MKRRLAIVPPAVPGLAVCIDRVGYCGTLRFIWLDSHGEGLPLPDCSRAYRRSIYRVPVIA